MPRPPRRSPDSRRNSPRILPARAPFALALTLALAGCQREPVPPPGGSLAAPEPTRPLVLAPPPPPLLPLPPTSLTPSLLPAPSSAAPAPSSVAPSSSSAALPPLSPPERPFGLVELAPTQGDLTPLVQEQVERALVQGRKPFVEFYADWCGPCQALHRALDDPRMIEAFRGTTILRLNVDDWKEKLPGTGFVPREIPVFYAVTRGGRPTGRSLQGLAWGRSVPENMAPKLKAFFGG